MNKTKLIGLLIAALVVGAGIFSLLRQENPDARLKPYDSTLKTYYLYGAGDSMLPLLKQGDVVRYQPYDFSRIEKGDVIVFMRNGYRVAHVAVRKEGAHWKTKGLNVESEDPEKIGVDEYVGILIVKEP